MLGHAHAHQTGQALGAAEAGGDAKAHLGLAEHGIVGADADVAGHGQLTAAAQGETVHRGDDRQGEALNHQEDVIPQLAEGLALRLGHGGHGADVGARHKALVPRAGEHHAAHGVLVDALESGLQVGQHLWVQRVESLGPVNGENRHSAL